jgi:histone acetyltransferase (RNA polymerase elongator complex component)
MGHPTDKIELIIMGGTFLAYPKEYQYQFIKDCYDALNAASLHRFVHRDQAGLVSAGGNKKDA